MICCHYATLHRASTGEVVTKSIHNQSCIMMVTVCSNALDFVFRQTSQSLFSHLDSLIYLKVSFFNFLIISSTQIKCVPYWLCSDLSCIKEHIAEWEIRSLSVQDSGAELGTHLHSLIKHCVQFREFILIFNVKVKRNMSLNLKIFVFVFANLQTYQ